MGGKMSIGKDGRKWMMVEGKMGLGLGP